MLAFLIAFSCVLTACTPRRGTASSDSSSNPLKGADASGDTRLNVVTTLFPYYDFLRQIAGDSIRLTRVVPAGMDSHSFEPTPAEHDIEEHIHSEDEHDMEDVAVHDEDHAQEYLDEDDGHGVEIEYDEHIWTSPVNAKKLAGVLAEVLAQEDPAHAASYAEHCASYQDKLTELDAEFREVVSHAKRRLAVFGDKFPLRYFFDEYGLEYRAAFSGCSTDTEPSAKTIAYLIDKVREEQIPAVYYLELSSPRVAEIIGEETGAEPLLFHSCHNVTRHQFDSGVTYLELMEQNVKNLKKGLS